jgi:hypothetical protein
VGVEWAFRWIVLLDWWCVSWWLVQVGKQLGWGAYVVPLLQPGSRLGADGIRQTLQALDPAHIFECAQVDLVQQRNSFVLRLKQSALQLRLEDIYQQAAELFDRAL